jgi:hypothetical protein
VFRTLNNSTVETPSNHGLDGILGLWNWGDSIRVINGDLSFNVTDSSGNLVSGITTPSNKTIDNANNNFTGSEVVGYLYVPPIPTYTHLATIIQTMLNNKIGEDLEITNLLGVSYDVDSGKFEFRWNNTQYLQHTHLKNLTVSSTGLLNLLGFTTNFKLYENNMINRSIASAFPTLGVTSVNLTPNNYSTTTSLITELDRQFNRFHLSSLKTYTFEVCSNSGTSYSNSVTCTVMHGVYTPITMSAYLTTLLAGVLDNATVTFTNNRFVFSAPVGFHLNFTNSQMAEVLGFLPHLFTGQSSYTSSREIYCPVYNNETRYNTTKIAFTVPDSQVISLHTCNSKPINMYNSSEITATQIKFDYTGNGEAHGLQVDDIVTIYNGNYGDTPLAIEARVIATDTAFKFTIDKFNINWTYVYGTIYKTYNPTFSLLVPQCPHIATDILGFRPSDGMWKTSNQGTYTGSYRLLLEPQRYIFLQIVNPSNGINMYHHFETKGLQPGIIAKIVLTPSSLHLIKKGYPFAMSFQNSIKLRTLKLRLINPDGTLYQLHGLEWAASFKMTFK